MRQYLVTTFVLIALVLLVLFAFTGSVSAQDGLTVTAPPLDSNEGLNEGLGILGALVTVFVTGGLTTVGAVTLVFARLTKSAYFIGLFEARYAKLTAPQKAAIREIIKFVDEVTDDKPYQSKAPGFNRPQDKL
jgi:hypothetical protein